MKTNLAVFSFPNAFLSFKKQEKKTKKSQQVVIPETSIYDYIQNMFIHVHISSFFLL